MGVLKERFFLTKRSNIRQLLPPLLHNRSRHNTNPQLLRKRTIPIDIFLEIATQFGEVGIFGEPVCQVVLGEDGEVAGLSGGGTDVGAGAGEV